MFNILFLLLTMSLLFYIYKNPRISYKILLLYIFIIFIIICCVEFYSSNILLYENFDPNSEIKTEKIRLLYDESVKIMNSNNNEDEKRTNILNKCKEIKNILTNQNEIDEYNKFIDIEESPIENTESNIIMDNELQNPNLILFQNLSKENKNLVSKINSSLKPDQIKKMFKLNTNDFQNLINELKQTNN